MEIGAVVERFWLDGPLTISALEQVRFLTRLAEQRLPLPVAVQAASREILRIDAGIDRQGRAWTLFAKSGCQTREGSDLGWWVGWLERGDDLPVFALTVELQAIGEAPRRISLGRALLVRRGALPAE
jgi:beta-lactamase class D